MRAMNKTNLLSPTASGTETEKHGGLAIWIATAAGAGYSPFAPGTAGSVVGLVIVAALGRLRLDPVWASVTVGVIMLLLFAVGVWAAGEGEEFFGRTDPGQVVIDEVVGQMLTMLLLPRATWPWLVGGFLVFRLFDILKPFPARQAERIPRGWGIMVDDLVAGLYGMVLLTAVKWCFQ